eukprot:364612-Chlamydomonas_euryale.AAC.8
METWRRPERLPAILERSLLFAEATLSMCAASLGGFVGMGAGATGAVAGASSVPHVASSDLRASQQNPAGPHYYGIRRPTMGPDELPSRAQQLCAALCAPWNVLRHARGKRLYGGSH